MVLEELPSSVPPPVRKGQDEQDKLKKKQLLWTLEQGLEVGDFQLMYAITDKKKYSALITCIL